VVRAIGTVSKKLIQGTQDVNGMSGTFGVGDRFTGIQAGIAILFWFAP